MTDSRPEVVQNQTALGALLAGALTLIAALMPAGVVVPLILAIATGVTAGLAYTRSTDQKWKNMALVGAGIGIVGLIAAFLTPA